VVTPESLLEPEGVVNPALFPDDDSAALMLRLQTYIDKANTTASDYAFMDTDVAVRALVLHRTFDAAYIIACSRPASEDSKVPILGSTGYAKDQRDALRDRSLAYLAEYEKLLVQVTTVVQPKGYQSREVTNYFDY
jgi:hypothetical protein